MLLVGNTFMFVTKLRIVTIYLLKNIFFREPWPVTPLSTFHGSGVPRALIGNWAFLVCQQGLAAIHWHP